jgi:hypothetical protein
MMRFSRSIPLEVPSPRKLFPLIVALFLGCGSGRAVPEEEGSLLEIKVTSGPDSVPLYEAPEIHEGIEGWTLDTVPELMLGGDEEDQSLFFYRVTAGVQLDGGSFVIADGGSLELRFFSGDGLLQRTVGRAGSGPGDFGSLDLISSVGDSLFVHDRWNGRIAVLDEKGTIGRYIRLPPRSEVKGVFNSGAILYGVIEPPSAGAGYSAFFEHFHVRETYTPDRPVGRYFSTETYWLAVDGDVVMDIGQPFGRVGSVIVYNTGWFFTEGAGYYVTQYDSSGSAVASFSFPTDPPPLTERHLDQWVAERRPGGGPWRFERAVRQIPLHETLPGYVRLLTDSAGNLWAKPFSPDDSDACWHVYRRHTNRFAEACLPPNLVPLDISHETVLGVFRDELDVEYVTRHRLIK